MPLSNLTHKTYEKNNHPNTHRFTYNSHDTHRFTDNSHDTHRITYNSYDTQRMQHRQDTCHTDR